MDLLISEMEKLLVLGRDDCDIQDIIGKNVFYFIIYFGCLTIFFRFFIKLTINIITLLFNFILIIF